MDTKPLIEVCSLSAVVRKLRKAPTRDRAKPEDRGWKWSMMSGGRERVEKPQQEARSDVRCPGLLALAHGQELLVPTALISLSVN